MKKFILFLVLAVIAVFAIDAIFFSGGNNYNTSSTKDEWYAGGNLHQATISVWKVETEKNKLATCADFVASQNKGIKLDMLKIKASALKTCIDTAVYGHTEADDKKVSEIAALCMVIMDN